jgi:hypothetical protein
MRTPSHRARAIVATLAASLALVTVIGPVAGTEPRPQAVTIVSPMTVPGNPNYGFFTASGSPLICASGDVIDTRLVVLRGSLESDFVLTVNKTFTCHDGSGTFFARLLVRMSGGVETFTWVILGGTGRYHDLFGLGSGSTVPFDSGGGVTNTYTGYLVTGCLVH